MLAMMVAVWVQVVGVYHYPSGRWDGQPLNVDTHPDRVWDWWDTTLSRNWHKGPAASDLYGRWHLYFTKPALHEPAVGESPGSGPRSRMLTRTAPQLQSSFVNRVTACAWPLCETRNFHRNHWWTFPFSPSLEPPGMPSRMPPQEQLQ